MRSRLVAGVIVFLLVGAVLGTVFSFGSSALSLLTGSADSSSPVGSIPTAAPNNPIARENAQPGTNAWIIPANLVSSIQIQAYASATNVAPGHSITFYVSTQEVGTPYAIAIYRLGWYYGSGGRLMATVPAQVGIAQGFYDVSAKKLVDCTSCNVNKILKTSGLIEANWRASYTLNVPTDWTTGVYLAKFIDAREWQTYAPFDVVRDNANSTYVAVTPDTTYAAYNDWGGASLYGTAAGTAGETGNGPRAVKVSFDKPYVDGDGASQVLEYEIQAIRWMERNNYDLSYISDVNLHENPGQLLNHKAYISLGHDEYWTKAMRDGVEAARNHGVGLAFMGADAAYWQMRFEPSTSGTPNRTVVCYKVLTPNKDLALDPMFGIDNTVLTSLWRDPALGRPENTLIGVMFSDLAHKVQGVQVNGFPWTVSASANSPLLKGTDLKTGQLYGCGIVGYEWDKVSLPLAGPSPPGLQIIATSNTINDTNQPDTGNTTYYIAPSGAMVFATGSISWANALDSYRLSRETACATGQIDPASIPGMNVPNTAIPGMQVFMANVMAELAVKHPTGTL